MFCSFLSCSIYSIIVRFRYTPPAHEIGGGCGGNDRSREVDYTFVILYISERTTSIHKNDEGYDDKDGLLP